MFGQTLSKELKTYGRHLWPFALAITASAIIAMLALKYDTNPYEATGIAAALGIFVMVALATIITTVTLSFVFYRKALSKQETAPPQFVAKFLAAMIVYFLELLIFAIVICLMLIFNDADAFKRLFPYWYSVVELIAFFIIVLPSVYLAPISLQTLDKYIPKSKIKTFLFVIIIASLVFLFPLFVWQIALIANLADNILSLWITICSLLAIYVLLDVSCFILIYKLVKQNNEASYKKQPIA